MHFYFSKLLKSNKQLKLYIRIHLHLVEGTFHDSVEKTEVLPL